MLNQSHPTTDKETSFLESILDMFFHIPTMVILWIFSISIMLYVYELTFDIGTGFARINSNHGQLLLYWVEGCCIVRW